MCLYHTDTKSKSPPKLLKAPELLLPLSVVTKQAGAWVQKQAG